MNTAQRLWVGREKQWFALAAPAAILVFALMGWLGAPLVTPKAPLGIVSYEFARTAGDAQDMIALWDAPARLMAAFTLGLDYVFMLAYASAISLGCLLVRGKWSARLAAGQWLAAGLDAVENIALTRMLLAAPTGGLAQTAFWCALFKFILIGLGLVYAVAGGLAARKSKPR